MYDNAVRVQRVPHASYYYTPRTTSRLCLWLSFVKRGYTYAVHIIKWPLSACDDDNNLDGFFFYYTIYPLPTLILVRHLYIYNNTYISVHRVHCGVPCPTRII